LGFDDLKICFSMFKNEYAINILWTQFRYCDDLEFSECAVPLQKRVWWLKSNGTIVFNVKRYHNNWMKSYFENFHCGNIIFWKIQVFECLLRKNANVEREKKVNISHAGNWSVYLRRKCYYRLENVSRPYAYWPKRIIRSWKSQSKAVNNVIRSICRCELCEPLWSRRSFYRYDVARLIKPGVIISITTTWIRRKITIVKRARSLSLSLSLSSKRRNHSIITVVVIVVHTPTAAATKSYSNLRTVNVYYGRIGIHVFRYYYCTRRRTMGSSYLSRVVRILSFADNAAPRRILY